MCIASILLVCGGGLVKNLRGYRQIMSRVDSFPDEPHYYYFAKSEICFEISSLTCFPLSDRPMGHPSSNTHNVLGVETQR